MARFTGKVAAVTGAGSGIGAAAALRFAAEGAAVLVSDINLASATQVAAEISKSGGRAVALRTDVASESDVAALVDRAVAEFGRLDVMVNNAGIGGLETSVDTIEDAAWRKLMSINLDGVFYGVKHAARVMKVAKVRGSIVNVSSILGLVAFEHAVAYTAAKHGVVGLTKAAALELAPLGIRVNTVNPAFIKTPLIAGLEEAVLPLHPAARLGTPEEVAALICFLGADEASFVTGASYLVDGGYVAK
ncbi:SDR family NAD(P)-dependent oxidoreductase [Pseudogemmatithrix spongiicola]|uniref:SDR family NAD(P)-dependent oxidoreductase n=1 Tax=Pseudogemmatithrix spongiicola TaxID=3062599 RepID=A0AA49JW65_9BACT|nr:SDR family NAD(P)-dependent oxidoreductase [Gemmatimonadaceae bacterium 'strain 138']WKW16192.1 SDR family NAD(P)-dependent oxidoreductase [Gemmatimonadaceae bacterium 'strain 318']